MTAPKRPKSYGPTNARASNLYRIDLGGDRVEACIAAREGESDHEDDGYEQQLICRCERSACENEHKQSG